MLTSASAFAHDIYGEIIKSGKVSEKEQVMVARIASIGVAAASIVLALFSQTLNVAFLSVLALGIAAAQTYRSFCVRFTGNALMHRVHLQGCSSDYRVLSF